MTEQASVSLCIYTRWKYDMVIYGYFAWNRACGVGLLEKVPMRVTKLSHDS